MSQPLLQTKLYIPPRRANLVARMHLTERLESAVEQQHGLSLVSAKAGAGKTTLVSEWLHQQERPVVWLSLDETDNDPRRFLAYLVAALQQINPQTGQTFRGLLESGPLPPPEDLAAALSNELAGNSTSAILVLDDYHLIKTPWIHQVVGFLSEHPLPGLHVILITRVDPPLSLGRLRGRGQMVEIRDRDLRFNPVEADQYLNHIMDLGLTAGEVGAIEERTEGWIVGLQMAGISLRGRKRGAELAAFIDTFGGTNRYILDYLVEEVLSQQPPDVQEFLSTTSILDRMCAGLCDALRFGYGEESETPPELHEESPQDPPRDSQSILAYLEQANLFVVPLDDERRWYRYHHLFADLLKNALRQRRPAEAVRALHRRASLWHQSQGSLEEAMIHAMAAQDYERAAIMIDENIVRMLSESEGPVLLGWIEKLPEHIVRGRPWIDINRAYALALSGRPEETQTLLESVERRIVPDAPRSSELMGHIAAIRAYTANLFGNAGQVFEMAALAEKNLPEDHLIARGMAAYALAVTHFAEDDMEQASRASHTMFQIGLALDRTLMVITALCDLASVKKVQGQLHQAEEYYERARQWMVEKKDLDSRVRSAYEVGLSELKYQQNQVDAAMEHARLGIQYCRRFDVPSELVSGCVTLMRACQAKGDVAGALEALRQAEQMAETHYLRLMVVRQLRAARVRQWLAVGDLSQARRLAEGLERGREIEQMALVHLWLMEGRCGEAQQLLSRLQGAAEAGGRIGRLVEILALQSIALDAQGAAEAVDQVMARLLSLARPEKYERVFLDLGEPFFFVLRRSFERTIGSGVQASGIARLNQDYARDLLRAFAGERQPEPPLVRLSRPEELPDPLTIRELEVLRLLSEGLANSEIAARLVVAPSTVRQHLKSIYAKLDVHNRTQAVARGRELMLI